MSKLTQQQAVAISFRRGGMAASSIVAVAYGLHVMGVADLWCIVAALALNAAWTVGYGAAISAAVTDTE